MRYGVLVILTVTLGSTILAVSAEYPQLFKYVPGQPYFITIDEKGHLLYVDLNKVEDEPLEKFCDTQTQFWLFTRNNPDKGHYIDMRNTSTLVVSHFNSSNPIKVIVHGWLSDSASDLNTVLTREFLSTIPSNVINFDWSKGSKTLYTSAVVNAIKAGEYLAKFLKWMFKQGVSPKKVHLIGHSLGAHTSGIAGRMLGKQKPAMITGMDPAAPLWFEDGQRIRPSDAHYVEIIHSNAGGLGLADPIGHNDFYPNGGTFQPGCAWYDIICDHSRSHNFYAYTINNTEKFQANLCKNHDEALKKRCSNLGKLPMGGYNPKKAMGSFYLETEGDPPFYKG